MFRHRIFSFGLLILVLTMAGLGCKGLSKEEQAAVRPVLLQYWTVYNDVAQVSAFAKEYQKMRPYVRVDVKQVRPEEFESLFVNALADDVSPDIVSIHTRSLPKYSSRLSPMPRTVEVARITVEGKYQPQTVVTKETVSLPTLTIVKNNFVATVARDIVVNNEVYGLPLALDTLAVYYNKNLLDKSGVPLAPATWEEFLDAVKKTTKFDRDGKIIQSGVAMGTGENVENAFDIVSLLMLQNGVTMTEGGLVTFAEGLDNRDVVRHPTLEALRFYTDFARPTKEVYSWNSESSSAFEAFTRGQSVFYLGFAYDYARIRSRAPQMSLEVISVPQLNPSQPVNVANYWLEAVPRKSKHPNEAWDFIRFMATPDNIKRYTTATRQPSPLRIHVAEQSEDPVMAPFATSILTADNWYHGRNIEAAQKAFADLIDRYLQPYREGEDVFKRDAGLVVQAAEIVQQTL